MVKKKGNDQNVQETNDSSILSKASIAEYGYFADPYLKLFCTRVVRRSPLIQRGYYIRAKAVDYVLKTFLHHYSTRNRAQIISLGAGFDSAYFRLKADNLLSSSIYYEVDFPGVVRRKQNIIKKQNLLMDVIGNFTIQEDVLQSKDYCIIPCDLTDIKKLKGMFIDSDVDFDAPTLFFSECAVTYIEYESTKRLCKWIEELFSNVSVMLYEQVNPNDSFGQVMQRHFEKIQCPLKRINQLDTISKQRKFFEALGFPSTVGFDMNQFYDTQIDEEEKRRFQKLEIFDEFEEWHLKCSHYCMVGAFQGECTTLAPHFTVQTSDHKKPAIIPNVGIKHCKPDPIALQRFGHSGCKLDEKTYFVSGGFGVTSNCRHGKLENGFVINFGSCFNDVNEVTIEHINMDTKMMYHSLTQISENLLFLFGGRVSPTKPKLEYGFYNIDANQLRPLETFELEEAGNVSQPTPRWRHAAAKLKDNIYIFGGRSSDDMALNDLWSYAISSKTWKLETLPVELSARHTHTLDVWNDKLVAFGGLSAQEVALNELLIISMEDFNFKVEEVTFARKLPPRYSHTSHVLSNKLYVIGGIDPTSSWQPPILIISLDERTWQAVHLPMSDPCQPLMLHNHYSVMLDEHEIAVIGGGGNCFSFGTYFNPDLTILHLPED